MPIRMAIKDSFGLKDVMMDTLDTLKGEGFSYRSFEPSEGVPHMGSSRTSRIMAGLRYSNITTKKHWLEPAPTSRFLNSGGRGMNEELVHDDDSEPLEFEDPDSTDEMETLYDASRKMEFGDYNYPVIDFRIPLWRQARRERRMQRRGYGTTTGTTHASSTTSKYDRRNNNESLLGPREGCIDVVVEIGKGNYVLVDDLSDEESQLLPDRVATPPPLPSHPVRKPTLSKVNRNLSSSSSTPTTRNAKHQLQPHQHLPSHKGLAQVKPSFSTPQNQASTRYPHSTTTSSPSSSSSPSSPPQSQQQQQQPTTIIPGYPPPPATNNTPKPSTQISSSEEDAPVWRWPDELTRKTNPSFNEDDLLSSDVWK